MVEALDRKGGIIEMGDRVAKGATHRCGQIVAKQKYGLVDLLLSELLQAPLVACALVPGLSRNVLFH